MGPFWETRPDCKGGFQTYGRQSGSFWNFLFFSFLWKHQLKRKKKLISHMWCGTISKVQSYLVTLKEAEKDKDEGRGQNSSSFFMQVKGLFLKTLFRF